MLLSILKKVFCFCASHDILRQTICSHFTVEWNLIERKLRHLLDVANNLLIHMHVPKSFWAEAIFHTCSINI